MWKRSIMAWVCGLTAVSVWGAADGQPQTVALTQGWEFSKEGAEEWLPAQVPGTVHQDLMNQGKLENPFFGMNEEKVQWVEKENWLYRTVFQVDSAQLARGAAELRFEGLDTYADVYLNGSLLLKSDNMFVGYTLPVKPVLRKGENRMMIRFRSAVNETLPQWESDGFNYPADNTHAEKRVSVYSRKAPYT